jgi:hypothetical protein
MIQRSRHHVLLLFTAIQFLCANLKSVTPSPLDSTTADIDYSLNEVARQLTLTALKDEKARKVLSHLSSVLPFTINGNMENRFALREVADCCLCDG